MALQNAFENLATEAGQTAITGALSDNTATAALSALNAAATVSAATSSGFMVLVTGTFVGSITTEGSPDGGTTWVATAWRQSVTGGIGNTLPHTRLISGVALLRGSAGGFTHYRARMSAYTSGTANVVINTHLGTAAVFPNVFVEVRSLAQYYASLAGGRVSWNSTTTPVTTVATGTDVALFENPTGSGVDAYINKIALGTNKAGRLERSRNPTITTRGTSRTAINRGGGTATPASMLYAGALTGGTAAQFTISGTPASGKVTFLGDNDNDADEVAGSLILPPGHSLRWHFDPDTAGTGIAAVEVAWWETTAAV